MWDYILTLVHDKDKCSGLINEIGGVVNKSKDFRFNSYGT